MDGFTVADAATLQVIRGNLLRGLDKVSAALADRSFDTVGAQGAAPPSQSGQTTLALLVALDHELATRTPEEP